MKDPITVRIESPAFADGSVSVAEIAGTETISRLFELTLRLVALDPAALDEEKLLTSGVELVFERTNAGTEVVTEERRIGGMIASLRDRFLTESPHREVVATFVPRAWQTTLTKTSDIFMDMSVPDIVRKKLETGAGLAGPDVELRLASSYPVREFVVQYKETDFDFICRLTEDLGIHFFFERKGDQDVIVFADENPGFRPALPASTGFMPRGDTIGVQELEATRRVVPRMFKARDYNYRNPAMDLLGEAEGKSVGASGVVDEFGPHAKDPAEAARYAQLRAEEAGARHFVFEGRSDLPGLRAGSVLKIEGHARGELTVVVTEVTHEAKQPVLGLATGDVGYHNRFKAIPEKVTYRPPRITPKPVAHGVVTGIVQAESATNFGAVDAEGRYRVSFMYDTVADRTEGKASRPLRMAQPSAGADRGFHQPLKPGTEVVITCLNGDPDRPIISGAVPNPQTPSPVTSANAEKSMWKTNVNQIAIDDDQPRMKMTVSGEDHLFQIGEPNGPEFGFMTGTVGNATSMTDNVSTTYSKIKSSWDGWKNGFASDNIVNGAGIPNPWAKWKKWEAMANAAVDTVKAASSLMENGAEMLNGDLRTAKKEKAAAEEKKTAADKVKAEKDAALEKALKASAVPDDAIKPRTTVKPGTNEVVTETRKEALERAAKDAKLNEGALEKAIGEAVKADKEAADAASSVETETKELTATEEGVYVPLLLKQGEPIGPTVSDLKAASKWMEETQAKLKSLKEHADNLVKLGSMIPGVKKLISKLSAKLGKVAHQAIDKTTNGFQLGAALHARSSGPRTSAKVGRFGDPHNIQYARGTAALHGTGNAFVFGKDAATVASRGRANLIGLEVAHVLSPKEAEVAAPTVRLTAKEHIDMWSGETAKLVAHPSGKNTAVPGGVSVLIHAKHDIKQESTDKGFELKVKKGVTVEAEEEHILFTAKKADAGAVAHKNILLQAETENVDIEAGKIISAKAGTDWTVEATKKVSLEGKEAMHLKTKAGDWKVDNTLGLFSKDFTVNAKSKVTIMAKSKIKLG